MKRHERVQNLIIRSLRVSIGGGPFVPSSRRWRRTFGQLVPKGRGWLKSFASLVRAELENRTRNASASGRASRLAPYGCLRRCCEMINTFWVDQNQRTLRYSFTFRASQRRVTRLSIEE